MKKWVLVLTMAGWSLGAFAQTHTMQDGFVALRTASSTNVFYDCDLATPNPDFTNTSTNDAAGDLDGDGSLNIEEFVAWTNPHGSNSLFRASGFNAGIAAGLALPSATGRLYTLESTTNMV